MQAKTVIGLEDPFRPVKTLEKEGKTPEALAKLRDLLRSKRLDASGFERAGRLLRKLMRGHAELTDQMRPQRVLLLGQCTTSWLAPTLGAVGWRHGTAALVEEGGYDTVLQDIAACASGELAPEVVVLLPWSSRLLGGSEPTGSLIDAEIDFWRRVWNEATVRLKAKVLQVGYDWVTPGPLGHGLSGRGDGPIGAWP